MDFKFIADENIPNSVIKRLRSIIYEVFSIREEKKGIEDEEIIRISKEKKKTYINYG